MIHEQKINFRKILIIIWLITPLTTGLINNTNYNILILSSAVGSKSHSIFFNAIASELATRRHMVTYRCFGQFPTETRVEYHFVNEHHPSSFMQGTMFASSHLNYWIYILKHGLDDLVIGSLHETYNEPLIKRLVEEPKNPITLQPKYDVVIIDAFFADIYLPLAHHIGAKTILISSTVPFAFHYWNLNAPFYYFFEFTGTWFAVDFLNRLIHFLFHSSASIMFNHIIAQKIEIETKKYLPNHPSTVDLFKNVSFMMTANPPSNQYTLPTSPNIVDIGCAHCRLPGPLPQKFEHVLENSRVHGLVYFSLGSIVQEKWIPADFINKIVKALSQLPQTILWKGRLNQTNLTNFYFSDWFPQQDLLAHPQLRLAINNGGLGTVQEALSLIHI